MWADFAMRSAWERPVDSLVPELPGSTAPGEIREGGARRVVREEPGNSGLANVTDSAPQEKSGRAADGGLAATTVLEEPERSGYRTLLGEQGAPIEAREAGPVAAAGPKESEKSQTPNYPGAAGPKGVPCGGFIGGPRRFRGNGSPRQSGAEGNPGGRRPIAVGMREGPGHSVVPDSPGVTVPRENGGGGCMGKAGGVRGTGGSW
jgi:hypothetical protein